MTLKLLNISRSMGSIEQISKQYLIPWTRESGWRSTVNTQHQGKEGEDGSYTAGRTKAKETNMEKDYLRDQLCIVVFLLGEQLAPPTKK